MKGTKLKESCNFIAKVRLRFGGNRKRDFANENPGLLSDFAEVPPSTLSSGAPNLRLFLRVVMVCGCGRGALETTLPAFYLSWPISPGTPGPSRREPPGASGSLREGSGATRPRHLMLFPLVPEDATGVQALTLAGPTLQ